MKKTFFKNILLSYLSRGGRIIFFTYLTFFIFTEFKFLHFLYCSWNRGRSGPWDGYGTNLIKFILTFPVGEISSLKKFISFSYHHFSHRKFIKFFFHLSRSGHSPSFLHFAPRHTYFRIFPNDYYEPNYFFN